MIFFLRRCIELLLLYRKVDSFRWAFGSRESVYASLHDRQQLQSRSPDVILERQIARYINHRTGSLKWREESRPGWRCRALITYLV